MSFSSILYEKLDAIGRITLNRPDVLNAYSVQMRDELHEVLQAVLDDDEVLVLIIRGAGRAFCAGADLREFGSAPSPVAARHVRFAAMFGPASMLYQDPPSCSSMGTCLAPVSKWRYSARFESRQRERCFGFRKCSSAWFRLPAARKRSRGLLALCCIGATLDRQTIRYSRGIPSGDSDTRRTPRCARNRSARFGSITRGFESRVSDSGNSRRTRRERAADAAGFGAGEPFGQLRPGRKIL